MCKILNMFLLGVLLAFSYDEKKEVPVFLQNAISIKGETIQMDFVGNPHEIVCIDSFILFSDYYENKALTVYDTKNDQDVGRFLSVGGGPGEVITPVNLFVTSEKKLGVYQYQMGVMCFYNFPKMNLQNKMLFDKSTSRDIKKTQNYYIGAGVYEKGRFALFNNAGKLTGYFGKYPFRGMDMEGMARFIIYQGHICTCPTRDFFAVCSEYCDNLEFYEIKDKSGILLKKYESYDANVQFIDQRLQRDDHTRYAYQWAYGTEKYFYALYFGKSNEQAKKESERYKYLIVFDWNGNHIKTYKIDVNMRAFCVDESTEKLYGVVLKEEFEIMRFDL